MTTSFKKDFNSIFPGVFNLSGSVQSVYLYITYKYCLTEERDIRLSYANIQNGDADCPGTGLNKSTIVKAIGALEEEGLIEIRHAKFKGNGGFQGLIPYYRPQLIDEKGEPDGDLYSTDFSTPTKKSERVTRADFSASSKKANDSTRADFSTGLEKANDSIVRNFQPYSSLACNSLQELHLKNRCEDRQLPILGRKRKLDKYEEACRLLRSVLVAKDLLRRKCSIPKWASDLRRASSSLIMEWDDLYDLLKWYCDNIGTSEEIYLPDVRSPKTFCAKIESIEGARNRQRRLRNQTSAYHSDAVEETEQEVRRNLTPEQEEEFRLQHLKDQL